MAPRPSATDTGLAFVDAVARKDGATLVSLLADPVRFRALTPSRSWEESTPEGVREVVLGTWFHEQRAFTRLLAAHVDADAPAPRLSYRFEVTEPDGVSEVEQVAFFDVTDGRITSLAIICSGFRSP